MRWLPLICLLISSLARAAFPAVESTISGEFGTDTATNIELPATISAGSVLVVCASLDASVNISMPSFTELYDQPTATGAATGACFASGNMDGQGGTTTALVWGDGQAGSYIAFSITDTFDGTPASVSCTAQSNAASTSHSTPEHTAGWGAEDNLWFATLHNDFTQVATAFPLPDTQINEAHSGGGGAGSAVSMTDSATASLDPGNYTTNSGTSSVTATCAIRPAAPAPDAGFWFRRRD